MNPRVIFSVAASGLLLSACSVTAPKPSSPDPVLAPHNMALVYPAPDCWLAAAVVETSPCVMVASLDNRAPIRRP